MAQPHVSVILPTYNRSSTLREAMESVLEQTYEDLELIVVDDGSTDDTMDVVQSVRDPRVRYIRLAENRGVSHARNVGLAHARGVWVAFQDSDDLWRPAKLEHQMDVALQAGEKVGVWGFWQVDYPDGTSHRFPRTPPHPEEPLHVSLLYRGLGICPQVVLLPADVAREVRFPETVSLAEDVIYLLRVATRGLPFRFIEEVLVRVRRWSREEHLSESPRAVQTLLRWLGGGEEGWTLRDRVGFQVWYGAPAAIRAGWRIRPLLWVLQGLALRVLSLRDALWFVRQMVVPPGRVG